MTPFRAIFAPFIALLLVNAPLVAAAPAASKTVVSFSASGPFVPREDGELSHTENVRVPAGDYQEIRFEMDVTVGPWPKYNPRAKLNLFWMVKSHRNPNMIGYAAVSHPAPGDAQLMLRQGIGVPHPKKTKDIKPVALVERHTYHVSYDYDLAGAKAVLVVSEQGRELCRIQSTPLLNPPAHVLAFSGEDTVTIDVSTKVGHNDPKAVEAPSLGWTYRNLHLMMERATPPNG